MAVDDALSLPVQSGEEAVAKPGRYLWKPHHSNSLFTHSLTTKSRYITAQQSSTQHTSQRKLYIYRSAKEFSLNKKFAKPGYLLQCRNTCTCIQWNNCPLIRQKSPYLLSRVLYSCFYVIINTGQKHRDFLCHLSAEIPS